MTKRDYVRAFAHTIASGFYPDEESAEFVLMEEGIDGGEEAVQGERDVGMLKCAVRLVIGYVETSRSEGGMSVGCDQGRIKENIRYWCGLYGVEEEDLMPVSVIEDGTHRW